MNEVLLNHLTIAVAMVETALGGVNYIYKSCEISPIVLVKVYSQLYVPTLCAFVSAGPAATPSIAITCKRDGMTYRLENLYLYTNKKPM
jgi:hypothetical protein